MKVALAQLDVKAGRPKLNVKRMIEMIWDAKEAGAELIAFPEMAVGGYMVGDKWTDDNYVKNLLSYNKIIEQHADGIVVIYGNVSLDSGFELPVNGQDGRQARFNSAYVCENKKTIGIIHKTNLPSYRIFDDDRYFVSSDEYFETRNLKPVTLSNGSHVGIEICEDMWHEDYIEGNITEDLILGGAEFIINISCSPWTYGKAQARDKVIHRMKDNLKEEFKPFYYVNACGVQNNGKNIITFDGDSRAYNADGYKLIGHLKPYEEGILYFSKYTVDFSKRDLLPAMTTMIEEKFNAIIRSYQGLDEMMEWKPNYVHGISGGVDSALEGALAVIALGKDRNQFYNLPSKYNSDKTISAARTLASNLDVPYLEIPIDGLVKENISVAREGGCPWPIPSLIEENIQAKIRGTSILSNLAAINNGVMTNNGNKLETALGYATLYGDVNGVFCPLGDLTKVEVFEMCRFINKKYGNPIPTEMLPINSLFDFGDGIAPSAELKEAQLDPMKFGYHDRMIEMVMDFKKKGMEDFAKAYLDGDLCHYMGISKDLFSKYGLGDPQIFIDDLEWFFRQIQRSVFKRIQAPPIVLLSKTAYGYDYRESQFAFETSFAYDELKERILL